MTKTFDNVYYINYGNKRFRKTKDQTIKEIIGIDTEAYTSGKCFMIGLSTGDAFRPEDFPECLFSNKYIDKNYVAYNLKYDEGALLQRLPRKNLKELWKDGKTKVGRFSYKIISGKCLSISARRHYVYFWDMFRFYENSLNYNAEKYLNRKKLESPVNKYTKEYVKQNYESIKEYCVNDAVLVRDLALKLVDTFKEFNIVPKKLYSTAYISFQHFKQATKYVDVKYLWDTDKTVLRFAMESYAGGKFETVLRGPMDLTEYDITSAYPYEIANLIDISNARIVWSPKYRPTAKYAFLKVKMKIPPNVFSPVPVKINTLNIYPVGEFQKIITKAEYDYLIAQGADISVINACWFHIDKVIYPYKQEINRLVELKKEYKKTGETLKYHTVKILLNSLYGKMVQLVKTDKGWKAGESWNPIYASIITANCRLRVTEMQQRYPEVVAVHTDSVLTRKPLDIPVGKNLGDWDFTVSGKGVICGSGIYQVGEKSRLRGFIVKRSLFELFNSPNATVSIQNNHARTWRETVFHNWEETEINRFTEENKTLNVNFDSKRVWLKDYESFEELLNVVSDSIPYSLGFGGL